MTIISMLKTSIRFCWKSKKSKKSAKDQFAKDILQDKDYLDFKNTKFCDKVKKLNPIAITK